MQSLIHFCNMFPWLWLIGSFNSFNLTNFAKQSKCSFRNFICFMPPLNIHLKLFSPQRISLTSCLNIVN